MKRTTWRMQVICAALSPLLGLASTLAVAGEPRTPMPTAPTLYYACMSAAGNNPSNSAEYDSAAFARKNPGPVYKDHYELNVKMTAAFDEYITQKYSFHGLVNCGTHSTLAEAQQWLQGRESQSRLMNYKYVATDWAYDAGSIESAPSVTTTTPDATAHAGQPAASAASEPTTFFACAGASKGVQYDSAVFEARNDALTARRMYSSFMVYLNEKYKVNAQATCMPRPTHAEAQAYLQQFSAGGSGGVTQHVATGWVYNPTAN